MPVVSYYGYWTRAISVLICISALGAANGLIFTGSRISFALGADHSAFRFLGRWNSERGAPVPALIIQCVLSLTIIIFAGSFIDTLLYTAPIFWLFFLATGISIIVLRRKDSQVERPYKIAAFPLPVLAFCAGCLFMLYCCITYAVTVKPIGLLIAISLFLTGGVVYLATRGKGVRAKNSN